jgi:hypothetical protein
MGVLDRLVLPDDQWDRISPHSAEAIAILGALRKRWPWVKHLFADGAYDRLELMDKIAYLEFVVEIIRRSDNP